jgi:hypothetical protein
MPCAPAPSHKSGGGGGSIWGAIWHVIKKGASIAYHVTGLSDIYGCISHPTVGGCAMALGDIAMYAVGGIGGKAIMAALRPLAERALTEGLAASTGLHVVDQSLTRVERLLASRVASSAVHSAVKPNAAAVANLLTPAVREALEPPGPASAPSRNSYTCARFALNC